MPEEENKKLRDLVSETLQSKGVLGRIQAEIRASVFLALEEQDVFKDKSPFINRQLKDFLKSSDGIAVISLVREFLEFFNLEFASMVFDPETQAGLDYNYEGRAKLASMLNLNDNDKHQPLLLNIIKMYKSLQNGQTEKEETPLNVNSRTTEISDKTVIKSSNHEENVKSSTSKIDRDKVNSKILTSEDFKSNLDKVVEKTSNKEVGAPSLSSLSNLPPIGKTSLPEHKEKKGSYDLKSLLDISSEKQYDDDFISSESEKIKKESKQDTISEVESEVEEISGISDVSAQPDDNTNDISISRASGHGDYLENL
ncbi:hypothetical protein O3M35_008858 [Rhynocoris fuscipes]|uniref:FGFR1 oncogene partner (FOP) N-terminal dimerisation domain-containing protein n=1 Tax=Rhynocoris fuscipes TaxID=488301 RepID=A0AAW1DDD3_9HEMI